MLQDRVSNPGPLTYESGALPIALRGPAEPPWDDQQFNYWGLELVCGRQTHALGSADV